MRRILFTLATIFVFIFGILFANEKAKGQETEVVDYEELIGRNEIDMVCVIIEKEPKGIVVTDEEYDLLLRVCMSECGGEYGEPMEGKIAVVETVLNRCEMYGMTIEEVLYAPNQYSMADNGEPDYTVINAVNSALEKRTYPKNMIYFRTLHYHSFGEPYIKIGSHYFSLEV